MLCSKKPFLTSFQALKRCPNFFGTFLILFLNDCWENEDVFRAQKHQKLVEKYPKCFRKKTRSHCLDLWQREETNKILRWRQMFLINFVSKCNKSASIYAISMLKISWYKFSLNFSGTRIEMILLIKKVFIVVKCLVIMLKTGKLITVHK